MCSFNVKTVLFQIIQLSIWTHFSSIWHIDWKLSGGTILGKSGPGTDGNVEHRSSSITGNSLRDCLESYSGHSLEGVLPLSRGAVSEFYSPSLMGKNFVCNFSHSFHFWTYWYITYEIWNQKKKNSFPGH